MEDNEEPTSSACKQAERAYPYLKIFVTGALSVTFISGIFSYLAGIEATEVDPSYEYIDGVICYSRSDNTELDWYHSIWICLSNVTAWNTSHSNNETTINLTSWFDFNSTVTYAPFEHDFNCYEETVYSSKSLLQMFANSDNSFISTFSSVKAYLFLVISFAGLYGIFVVVHDCTLIYYKSELHKVRFYPQSLREFPLSKHLSHVLTSIRHFIFGCGVCSCCQWFVFLFCALILMILFAPTVCLDLILMLVLYPFYSCFAGRNSNGVCGFSYVSSAWVGLARIMLVNFTTLFLYKVSVGFESDIPSLRDDECRCQCNYILRESDLWLFLLISVVFIVLNTKFLLSWVDESVHDRHYLYLITYRLPIEHAHEINPKDPTGSMMHSIKTTAFSLRSVRSPTADEYVFMEEHNENALEQDEVQRNHRVLSIPFRLFFTVISVAEYGIAMFWLLVNIGDWNVYDYSQAVTRLITVVGWLGLFVFIVALVLWMMRFKSDIETRPQ